MSGATVPENIPPIEEWICRPLLCPNDPEWWALITGVLLQLSYGYYWDKDSGDWEAARYAGRQIMVAWGDQDVCSGPLSSEGNECQDYDLESPIISWAPNDPFRTPNLIPSGYALPPWYRVGVVIPYVGLQPGDIITDLLHSPFNTLASGFPRFRINLNGSGTVELHMLRFPTASIVFITIDDNPTSSRWQDLNSTLSPVGGAFDPVSIIEVDVTGSGQHHIDVTIVSSVGESFPFVHFGGGIRKINLCGFDVASQPIGPITELEYEMAICEQLRWNDGVLEGYCCGEWVAIPGATGGVIPGPIVQPPGQSRPPAGTTTCFNIALSAKDRWQLPFAVIPGDIVTVSNISGTWSDGGISPWYLPDGHTAIFGASTGTGQIHDGGDPYATPYHMSLVAFTPAEDFQVSSASPFTIGGSGSQQLTFQANDGSLDDNSGTISFRVCVENVATPPEEEWCYEFDFEISPYAWVPSTSFAVWVPGSGFEQNNAVNPAICEIGLSLTGSFTITDAEIVLETDNAGASGTANFQTQAGIYCADNALSVSPGGILSCDANEPGVTDLYVSYSGGTSATYRVKKVTIRGIGGNPFGTSTC